MQVYQAALRRILDETAAPPELVIGARGFVNLINKGWRLDVKAEKQTLTGGWKPLEGVTLGDTARTRVAYQHLIVDVHHNLRNYQNDRNLL